jgi:hypothetical protein
LPQDGQVQYRGDAMELLAKKKEMLEQSSTTDWINIKAPACGSGAAAKWRSSAAGILDTPMAEPHIRRDHQTNTAAGRTGSDSAASRVCA